MNQTSIDYQLAVVIPAYKRDFLAKALTCLVRQTDQRFNIYIFDDASPANIKGIAERTLGTRAFNFRRFDTNLGGTSLPRHWNRCLEGITEPWIWLFSDDDLMEANCVESFYRFLNKNERAADVIRFDAWTIDEDDRITGLHSRHLGQESWLEFSYCRLMGWRPSFMQQHIFRRTVLEQSGGFVDFPLAWYTDDAFVIAMGRHRPIQRIPDACVYWRSSSQNITPARSPKTCKKKFRAACLFLQWLQKQLENPREHLFLGDDQAFRDAMDRFLIKQISIEGSLSALLNWNLLSTTRARISARSRWSLLRHILIAALDDCLSTIIAVFQKVQRTIKLDTIP